MMTSAQARTVFEAALEAGVIFPGWSYLLAMPVVVIGAYFAGYRTSKRERAEMKAQLELIRLELARIGKATDSIQPTSTERGVALLLLPPPRSPDRQNEPDEPGEFEKNESTVVAADS